MKKEIIRQLQRKVVELLRKNSNKPLYMTSIDNCSEAARLVGCWIFEKLPQAKIYILKGKNVQNTKLSHDILAVEHNGKLDLIDPTIWQFFKNKRSIVIKTTDNLANSLFEATKLYSGKWKISEEFKVGNHKKDEFQKIIASNIQKTNQITPD